MALANSGSHDIASHRVGMGPFSIVVCGQFIVMEYSMRWAFIKEAPTSSFQPGFAIFIDEIDSFCGCVETLKYPHNLFHKHDLLRSAPSFASFDEVCLKGAIVTAVFEKDFHDNLWEHAIANE